MIKRRTETPSHEITVSPIQLATSPEPEHHVEAAATVSEAVADAFENAKAFRAEGFAL
jgi:hypothetical protein